MAKNDQQEAYEKILSALLGRVIDFVKFAETKNAASLTFSSAWILSIANFLNSNKDIDSYLLLTLILMIILFTISAAISIVSFLPKIDLDFFHRDPERSKSLIFFGDIATFSPESYRDRVRERYFPESENSFNRNVLDDVSVQINVNSSIAVRKFNLFNASARFIFGAIILLCLYEVIHYSMMEYRLLHTTGTAAVETKGK